MDLGFSRSHPFAAPRAAVRLDYPQLIAGIAAVQARTPTAEIETRLAARHVPLEHPVEALRAVFAPRGDQATAITAAVRLLDGSFHPAVARNNGGDPP